MLSSPFTTPIRAPGGNGQTETGSTLVKSGATNAVTIQQLLSLVEGQGYRCAMTGRPLTPETASVDHIIPCRRGGKRAIENIQIVHKDVNRAKGTMEIGEFVSLCRDVVAWADQNQQS